MKKSYLGKLSSIVICSFISGFSINHANASVAFNCNGDMDAPVCSIQKGNNSDGFPGDVITQSTIDTILKNNTKAAKLTIEFTKEDYTAYPLVIDRVNNLTFKLDSDVSITAIPRDTKNKTDKKNSDPWKDAGHLISFTNCNNLTLTGGKPGKDQLTAAGYPKADTTLPSVIDGHGQDWWSAFEKDKHIDRPTLLYFHDVDGLTINNLEFRNSARAHLMIRSVKNITINQILIHSDKDSPNTDGINIGGIQGVNISNSTIYNGDDSIAINSGGSIDRNIHITNMDMYYGHGISVGSHVDTDVESVTVDKVNFHYTHNGLRFKTQCSSNCLPTDDGANITASTSDNAKPVTISNIHYNHIQMEGVKNPIIYDFSYGGKWSKVQIHDTSYADVQSVGKSLASSLVCQEVNGCKNISFDNVSLETGANCQNIAITEDGKDKKYNKQSKCLINKD